MPRIKRIVFTEVIVPARDGAVNSAGVHQPLHMLPVGGQAAWTKQFDELPKCLIELTLDNGIVGLGEFYRDHDWRILEDVTSLLLDAELGELPRQQLPIARTREYDGFECAIWDAYAKLHDVPLVDLLGGAVRSRVKVGAWSGHRTLEEVGPIAGKFQEQEYDCIKLKCGLEDDVVGWCEQIAEHAKGMQVILDPNQRWERAAEARRRIDGLRQTGNVLCLEDPIPRWMLHEYANLKQYSSIPIVLHVSLPYIQQGQCVHDATRAIQLGAIDGFNFNGGLVGFQQLDRVADAAGLCCWHGSEIDLGILEAMYVHQCAAALSCAWPSDIFGRMIREHDLLIEPIAMQPPWVSLLSGAGLGVEIDRDAVRHYQTKSMERSVT